MAEGEIELVNSRSTGGTEMMARSLARRLDPSVLRHFQIIPSRVREFDPARIPIYWLHDLPEGKEAQHLCNGGWNRFHKLVYVSNWQAQLYQRHFGIPWHKGHVLLNAIGTNIHQCKKQGSDTNHLSLHPTSRLGIVGPRFRTALSTLRQHRSGRFFLI